MLSRSLAVIAGTLAALAAIALAGCPSKPVEPPAAATPQAPSAPASPYDDNEKHPPIDPVARNGTIFEGWTTPKWALVISGEQNGYLEPCGCAGLENQKGGLIRRYRMLEERRQQGWPIVAVDLGNQVRRYGAQAEMQLQTVTAALRAMDYSAATYGPADLRLPGATLLTAAEPGEEKQQLYTSANVGVLGFDSEITPPYRIVEVNGLKVGIVGVLGDTYRAQVQNEEVEIKPAADAIRELGPDRFEARCEVRVLLAHATQEESVALAREFKLFHVVVSAGGADEPPATAEKIEGTETWLVQVGTKGMYAGVLAWYDDQEMPIRYQRVPLDARFGDAPAIKDLLIEYQDNLRLAGFDNLGARAAAHPRAAGPDDPSGQFVGAARCGSCHKKAFAKWSTTKHAQATETLTRLDPPRQFDPECISCHSTGWNPQGYLPYLSGFRGLAETPQLAGNGCENCHGPGRAHAEIEERRKAREIPERDQLRLRMRLTKATVEQTTCILCHDQDNSPEFHHEGAFEQYWAKVEHKGKD